MSWWSDRLLPHLVDRTCGVSELDPWRDTACAGLRGRVLELGFGSGTNLDHYPPEVEQVDAVEPSDVAWRLAAKRIVRSGVRVERSGLDGEHLPYDDATFDAVLSTFTLCTIPDAEQALAEVRRVLKPGGSFHFLEHGLAPTELVQRLQHGITPVWRRFAGGCHVDRPIDSLVTDAGLDLVEIERAYARGPKPFSFFYVGRAERR